MKKRKISRSETPPRRPIKTTSRYSLFIYPKGQDYDEETVEKNAARGIVELFPHNFTKTTYKTYQAVNGRYIFLKLEYCPAIRIPSDPEYQAINRFTMLRFCTGSREDQASRIR
jgi:hypothetical protein